MRILVALSGGVDSSTSALLLKQAGHDVSCAYMKTWMNEENNPIFANCPWAQDIQDAQATANHLNLPFDVVNLIDQYNQKVVQYLVQGYKNGFTPNPDLMCNREIKFGVFLDYAIQQGFDAIATGHYVQKITNPDGSSDIYEALDKNKDQSYFLSLLNQSQLSKAIFPIGHLTKPQVRSIAQQFNLPTAHKKDSQGICFIGKININDFLSQYIPDQPGPIANLSGQTLGLHSGLHKFTLGQRKGINVPSNTDFEKYVVVSKDYSSNTLVIAFESQIHSTPLVTSHATISHIHHINSPIPENTPLLAKPRYRDPSTPISLSYSSPTTATIHFSEPQRALAKGQLLAIYHNQKLLGGGFYS